MHHRRQRPGWAAADIAQIDVIGTGLAGAIRGRDAVADLARPGDLHADRALRQAGERFAEARAHTGEARIHLGDGAGAAGIVVAVEIPRVLAQRVQARADRSGCETLLLQQRIGAGRKLRDLVECVSMGSFGIDIERRARLQRQGVIGIAIRQPPRAGLVRCLCAQCAERGDLTVERGNDRRRRRRAGRGQFRQRRVEDEIRRHDSAGRIGVQLRRVGIDRVGEYFAVRCREPGPAAWADQIG